MSAALSFFSTHLPGMGWAAVGMAALTVIMMMVATFESQYPIHRVKLFFFGGLATLAGVDLVAHLVSGESLFVFGIPVYAGLVAAFAFLHAMPKSSHSLRMAFGFTAMVLVTTELLKFYWPDEVMKWLNIVTIILWAALGVFTGFALGRRWRRQQRAKAQNKKRPDKVTEGRARWDAAAADPDHNSGL